MKTAAGLYRCARWLVTFFYRVGLYSLGGLSVVGTGLAALWAVSALFGQSSQPAPLL